MPLNNYEKDLQRIILLVLSSKLCHVHVHVHDRVHGRTHVRVRDRARDRDRDHDRVHLRNLKEKGVFQQFAIAWT